MPDNAHELLFPRLVGHGKSVIPGTFLLSIHFAFVTIGQFPTLLVRSPRNPIRAAKRHLPMAVAHSGRDDPDCWHAGRKARFMVFIRVMPVIVTSFPAASAHLVAANL
jgi:hypothetical protein